MCPHTDTLIVMFEYTPMARERKLDFNYSEALLVRGSNITIIGDSSKIEALYREYNTKYLRLSVSRRWGFILNFNCC